MNRGEGVETPGSDTASNSGSVNPGLSYSMIAAVAVKTWGLFLLYLIVRSFLFQFGAQQVSEAQRVHC